MLYNMCHVMLKHVSCYVKTCVMLCYNICHVMLYNICHVMLCYITCHFMASHVMLCYIKCVMSCYVI